MVWEGVRWGFGRRSEGDEVAEREGERSGGGTSSAIVTRGMYSRY